MKALTYATGKDSLYGLLTELFTEGDIVTSRGFTCSELRNVIVEVTNPYDTLMGGIGRGQNMKLAAMEALQLIGGFSSPAKTIKAAPNMAQFVEDDGSFWGAYGARTWMQFRHVVRRLTDDPGSRQAVVTLWDWNRDLRIDGRKDYPCTLNFVFAIRDGQLLMETHMRSNDVWWGWTYDLFQFTQLQITMANVLDLPAGPYTHYVNSMHVYERDFKAIETFLEGTTVPWTSQISDHPAGIRGESWSAVASAAEAIVKSRMHGNIYPWYVKQISSI